MIDRSRTDLKFEFAVAEEGRLSQHLEALVVVFDARLVIIPIQVRIGLDESRESLNVRNDPFQGLFKVVSTRRNILHAMTPTAKVQFLIPCC